MDSTFSAVLGSWPFDPWIICATRHDGRHLPARLARSASPRPDSLARLAHCCVQHWTVDHFSGSRVADRDVRVATSANAHASALDADDDRAPLLWLGAPLFPLLRGLPRSIRTTWVAPILRLQVLKRTFEWLTHPVPAWLLFAAATWIWHLPRAYELALASDGWHYLQHVCFLMTGLLFWYPVIRPFPSRPGYSPWLLIPYLILADVQNTLLAAWLTFSDHLFIRTMPFDRDSGIFRRWRTKRPREY